MEPRSPDEHERAAAGLDFDERDSLRDGASSLGAKMMEDGPGALLEEVENLLPESWREQIRQFPIAAVVAGLGVGIFLGMKKGDEVLAAGTSLVSAAAMANVSQIIEKMRPD